MISIYDINKNVLLKCKLDDVDSRVTMMTKEGFHGVHCDPDELQQALSDHRKIQLQSKLAETNSPGGDKTLLALSIIGKASNALAATLNLQMQIFQHLAVAQSFAEVNAAVQPAIPLMQRISGMLERGELMSVQHAQGMTDDDAIIEAMESMTKVAHIIRDYEHAQSANVAT